MILHNVKTQDNVTCTIRPRTRGLYFSDILYKSLLSFLFYNKIIFGADMVRFLEHSNNTHRGSGPNVIYDVLAPDVCLRRNHLIIH